MATTTTEPYLTPAQHRRSMNAAVISSIGAIIAGNCFGGSVLSLFALKLGAGERMLGLLPFVIAAPAIAKLFTMRTIERVGKRRVLLVGFSAAAAIALPFMALPFLAQTEGVAPTVWLAVLLVVLGLRATVVHLAITGWFPILQDVVPDEQTGRFFANLRVSWQAAGLATMLFSAWLLGDEATWRAFALLFAIGVAASVVRALAIIPMSELPPQPRKHAGMSMAKRFAEVWAQRRFRTLIAYITFYALAIGAAEPFKVKLIKDLGFSDRFVVMAAAMTGVGAIVSLRFWGKLADRYGNRAVFSISHVGMIVSTLMWLLVDAGTFGGVLVFVLYFLASAFNSGNGIAQTRYLLHAVQPDKQNQITIINMISNVGMGVAPMVAGLLLHASSGWSFASGALSLNNYHMLFVLTALLFIPPHILRRRLGLRRETPTAQVLAFVSQAVRNTFDPFVRLGRRSDNDSDVR